MKSEVEKLIEQLKDTSILFGVSRRRNAVKKLGQIGTPNVVVPIVNALSDDDAEVKRNAFLALSSLKDPTSQEILRNLFLKTGNKAIWQIIKNNKMYPSNIAEKIKFMTLAHSKEELSSVVDEIGFSGFVEAVIEGGSENSSESLKLVIEKCDDQGKMFIIKKYLESRSDILLEIIEHMEWYPPELDKKLMFLLKTQKYQKIIDLLDGDDFRKIIDILSDPDFPMKASALECFATLNDQFIIDEICKIFLREGNLHLGRIIMHNKWSPERARDKVFFYLRTTFLHGFFKTMQIDPLILGGYLEIPEIKDSMPDAAFSPLADFLAEVASTISEGRVPSIDKLENPLADIYVKAKEYLGKPKTADFINSIYKEYLDTKNYFLGYLIVQMDWAPEDTTERTEFYLRFDQEEKIKKMNDKAIEPLYLILSSPESTPEMVEKAKKMLKSFKNPKAIDQVFRIYFKTKDRQLEEIIKINDWKPNDKIEKVLYFIFSNQPSRFKEVDDSGSFRILFDAYVSLEPGQRFAMLEVLLGAESMEFVDFLFMLLEYERNPRILKLIGRVIIKFFKQFQDRLMEMIPRMEGPAVKMLVKELYRSKIPGCYEMLYHIALTRPGYTCFWILKLLEDVRWIPQDPLEKKFFYELYKIRDEMMRILQNRLVDEDPETRAHSAYMFSQMGDERYLGTLMKYVEDPVEEVRAALAYSIGYLCALNPEGALEQIDSFRIGSIFMIFNDVRKAFMVPSEEEQLSILARNYSIGNIVLREFAVAVLLGLEKPESVPTLVGALNDESIIIRRTAMKALVNIPDNSIVDMLFAKCQDDDEEIRMNAALALGYICDQKTSERILRKINSGDFFHADSLVTALSMNNPEKYRDLFEKIIKQPSYNEKSKAACIRALGKIGDTRAITFLTNQLNSARSTTTRLDYQIPYIEAFGRIGGKDSIAILDSLFRLGNWETRSAVMRAYGNINDRAALVCILKSLEDKSGWVQLAALEGLAKYYNLHFKFLNTEKDLQFVGAIVNMLKKFKFNEVADKNTKEYELISMLYAKVLEIHFTRIYLKHKDLAKKSAKSGGLKLKNSL